LGFEQAIVPKANKAQENGIKVNGVTNISMSIKKALQD